MKGRKLTLQEVLNLEDGTKVWLESEEYNNKGQISYLMKDDSWTKEDLYPMFRLSDSYDWDDEYYDGDLFDNLIIYEWIEDLIIPKQIEEPHYSYEVVESMAYEIASLRYPKKYEYDDELINKIIKEFS